MHPIRSRIAVLHHLGAGNLGDEAALESVIKNILKRQPDAQVTAITMNPGDTSMRYGIHAIPIRSYTWAKGSYDTRPGDPQRVKKNGLKGWLASTRNPLIRIPRVLLREIAFLVGAFRSVRRFDVITVSGGGQLTGRSGPWGFPFGIFVWMSLAKLAGIKRIILNVGAGPLNHPLVKFFSIRALKAANYVSFRDARSQALVVKEGFKGAGCVLADNAYLIDIPQTPKSAVKRENPVVGINPMPYPFCDPQEIPSGHQQVYEDYIGKLAAFASALVKSNYSIELFGNDVGVDPRAIEDLHRVLRDRYQIQLPPYRPDRTLAELLARTGTMDYILTCRFHGVVFAHLLNKPVLAIAHHVKVTTAMAEIGLSEYCFEIATFDPNQLTDAFVSMVSHSVEIKQKMAASLAGYRARLITQYDELFPPVPAKGPLGEPRLNPECPIQVERLPHQVA